MAWWSIITNSLTGAYNTITSTASNAWNTASQATQNAVYGGVSYIITAFLNLILDTIEPVISAIFHGFTGVIVTIAQMGTGLGILGLPIFIIGLVAIFGVALTAFKMVGEVA